MCIRSAPYLKAFKSANQALNKYGTFLCYGANVAH